MSGDLRAGQADMLLDVLARVAFGEDDARVPVDDLPADDPVHELGTALNLVLDELARRRLAGERAAAKAAAYESRHDVLSHVTHEMMTPLTIVVGALETLPHVDEPTAQQLLDKVQRAARKLRRDVDALMDTARDAADLAALVDAGAVDVGDVVQQAVELRSDIAPIRLELGAGRLVAFADPDRVEDVVGTLLDNAVKHGKGAEDGIHVEVVADDHEVTVSVPDRGPGLSEGQAERVFERFVQGGTSADGSGFGLHGGRKLAEAMGGRLDVLATPGFGATFRLVLPRRVPDAPEDDV